MKALRKASKLSQSEVAKKIGISLRAYADYELGNSKPRTESRWNALANLFRVSVGYLKVDEPIDDILDLNLSLQNNLNIKRIQEEKKISNIVHQYLQKKGYLIQEMKDNKALDLIAINPKSRDSIGVEIKVFYDNTNIQQQLINFYGRLVILNTDFPIDKLLLVTKEKSVLESIKKNPPYNLKLPLLVSIVDVDNSVMSEFVSMLNV